MDGCVDGWVREGVNGWIEGEMNVCTVGWADGWVEG